MKSGSKVFPIFFVFGLVLFDQITKIFASNYLQSPYYIYSRFIKFVLVHNTGAAFGSLKGMNLVLILISFVVLGYFAKNWTRLPKPSIAIWLILSGILGNLIDRIIRGAVIDFISVGNFPVFNIADSCITIGVALIIFFHIREIKQKS